MCFTLQTKQATCQLWSRAFIALSVIGLNNFHWFLFIICSRMVSSYHLNFYWQSFKWFLLIIWTLASWFLWQSLKWLLLIIFWTLSTYPWQPAHLVQACSMKHGLQCGLKFDWFYLLGGLIFDPFYPLDGFVNGWIDCIPYHSRNLDWSI